MSVSADIIRDKQRIVWDQFAAGWKKWDAELLGWQGPFGDALIHEARLHPGALVLDVAAGSGEPGLTAAALVPDGTVVLTDISAGMLKVAEVKAAARGLQNVRFEVCDAAALPLADESFDAVFCRFGFMFFPEISPALREMVRTARPGARITAAVWGRAAENPWASLILGTLAHHTVTPAAAPGDTRIVPVFRGRADVPPVPRGGPGRRQRTESQHRAGARVPGALLGIHDRHCDHRGGGPGEG